MKAIRLTLMASAVATVLSVGMTSALAAGQSVPASASENTTKWFVEFNGLPTSEGGRVEATRSEKAAFRQAAAKAGIKFKERRAFDALFNGVSIEISPAQRAKLSRLAGIKAMYPIEVVQAPKPVVAAAAKALTAKMAAAAEAAVPNMNSALAMTGADLAQSELGLTGAGIKVGVIDTGIDIDHPALGGHGVPGGDTFPTARVAYGYDFVGDAYNADPASPSYNPVPTPDANPDDCAGHGSHVAGIVGANGPGITGVAPGVTFGAYRVFGCAGSTDSDILLAAMERAQADGMNVINQSLGAAFQWPEYPTAKAADRLVKAGIVMVASIGNNGTSGLYAAGAPGVGKKVIGVASYDNTEIDLREFTLSTGGAPIGFADSAGAPAAPTSGSAPLARTGTTASLDDGCAVQPAGSLTGMVALIRRGTCSFYQKAFNAQTAGAVGVVLYNNTTGLIFPTVAGTPAITVPVASITAADGALIDSAIQAGPVSLTWTPDTGSFPNSTGNLISPFSSYGLTAELGLKPNIGAPGGFINSTYPLELGGYATLNGTSMSSPHVAGGVALVLQANPAISSTAMAAHLQNTADPKVWAGNPGTGFLDNVHRQGAGMLDLMQTLKAKTLVTPSQLSLGESQPGPVTSTLTLKNKSSTPVTYDVSHAGALATGPSTFVPSFFNAPAGVAFSATSVTVPARGTATVDVTVTAPGLPDRSIYGGYVVFTAQGEGGETLRVPFAGYQGDYQAIQVLTPTANGFPWLAQLIGTSYFNRPTGGTFTMAGTDLAYFLVHMDHFGRTVKLQAYDATTGKLAGVVSNDAFVPRSSTSTGFYSFAWDGTLATKSGVVTAPNGSYVIKMSVLKALGDKATPADTEVWTSPVTTIARP
ncbi:MAG TPA: S8 family serine peptidase [Ideonella sp.]|nr:S8 family serine peptidase [Ideonella sp.]